MEMIDLKLIIILKFIIVNQELRIILPFTNIGSDIGSITFKYDDIFARNGSIQTSDEQREKYYIQILEEDK